MDKFKNPEVAAVFNRYPEQIQQSLLRLRQLVLDTAAESEDVVTLEETLKWREPSYLTKSGGTVRLDWKRSTPDEYALYFHCKTRLVDTFKELYGDQLTFEGNKAILFRQDEEVPIDAVKHCILLSLTYHSRKHLPMLGV
jgi:hypothetical protein